MKLRIRDISSHQGYSSNLEYLFNHQAYLCMHKVFKQYFTKLYITAKVVLFHNVLFKKVLSLTIRAISF